MLAWLWLLPLAQAQDRMEGAQNRSLPQSPTPAVALDLPLALGELLQSPQVVLPVPPSSMRDDLLQRVQQTRNAPGVPMRVGTERSIDQTGTADRLRAVAPPVLQTNGSYRVTLKVRSPKAFAVRLGLQFTDVDPRVSLRFFASDAQTQYGPTSHGEEILEMLAKNMASKDLSDNAVTWWSPTVDGDAIFVVLDMPDKLAVQGTRLAITQISHMEFTAKELALLPYSSGACNIDAVCQSSYTNAAAAVAQIRFQSGGYTYSCSGTLMNNSAQDYTAYFLTANHCINTQTQASSVETQWFMQAQTCNAPSVTIDPRFTIVTGGADLLYNAAATDTSFLRLRGTPPAEAYFSGWDATAPAPLGSSVVNIHHPSSDIKKISSGSVLNYQNCTEAGNGYFTCTTASGTAGNFVNARLTSGTTEPGSSGSGLIRGGDSYLIGQLYGGNSSCSNPSGSNIYGRFDVAYFAGMKNWLWPSDTRKSVTVSRLGTGSGSVTSAPAGINCGSVCTAAFTQNSSVTLTAAADANNVFAGWSGACAGSGSTCTLSMTADRSVSATFNAIGTRLLSFSKSGNGTVSSSPSGINCGAGCSSSFVSFNSGTMVTLSATPDAGYIFNGWSGACTGTVTTCTVSMNANRTVGALFNPVGTLSNNVPVSNISAPTGTQLLYKFTLPSNASISSFKVQISGSNGDADLYVKRDRAPTAEDYDCAPLSYSSNEFCSVSSPGAGTTYYVLIDAFYGFSGLQLSLHVQGTATLTIVKKGSGNGTVYASAVNNAQVLSMDNFAESGETPRTMPKDLRPKSLQQLRLDFDGLAPVIVGLRVPFAPEGEIKSTTINLQRQDIRNAQGDVVAQLRTSGSLLPQLKTFEFIPYIALHASQADLDFLLASPEIISIEEDRLSEPMLNLSAPHIGATTAWTSGYTGAGQTVAVLDTGVDKTHPFLSGKVVSEACYSTNSSSSTSLCPGGVSASTSSGSAMPCTGATGCDHGTHVAGIAAGKGASFSGVAKDANLIAMQVFSRTSTGIGAFNSDTVKALERVYELRNTHNVASVNMSLGSGLYTSFCDSADRFHKAAIDNLRSVGIATIVAAGNDGATRSIAAPACISSAVSVGSVYADAGHNNNCRGWSLGLSSTDQIACSSNSASFLNLLAPGAMINSSIPGGAFGDKNGTSMAAPQVAGAWALYKQRFPQSSVTTSLRAFEQTGTQVLDPRNNITKPRINVAQALSLSPADLVNCGAKCTVTLNLGDQITFTNTPAGTNLFANWSGSCTGQQSTCTVTVDGNQTITAAFDTVQVARAKKLLSIFMLVFE
jgi:uncharacterized repeat protein (TIGR02543 family)